MMPIKEFINKIKYDPKENPDDYILVYRDFDKESEIKYTDIENIEGGFLISKTAEIPLHRIRKVLKNGEVVWARK